MVLPPKARQPPCSNSAAYRLLLSKLVGDVCRQLQFLNGEDGTSNGEETISEAALEHYARIFENTLSHDHVKALAALFGWNAPSSAEVRSMADISVC